MVAIPSTVMAAQIDPKWIVSEVSVCTDADLTFAQASNIQSKVLNVFDELAGMNTARHPSYPVQIARKTTDRQAEHIRAGKESWQVIVDTHGLNEKKEVLINAIREIRGASVQAIETGREQG